MKKLSFIILLVFLISGCSNSAVEKKDEHKIGILLSDAGLGDESFNDSAFRGLEQARDEFGITFDYREAPDGELEKPLTELVEQGNDIIIGLGFSVKEGLETVAKKYPDQQFLLIDEVSELENIASITFKEQEGSFLVGMVAAMTSKTDKIGFVGGVDVPLIHHFEAGFKQGVKYVKPNAEVFVDYAGSFDDVELGKQLATAQIDKGADFIYHAAGFTGYGILQTAQERKIYAAGVDTDQFFVAEKAVVTSMLKNVDQAVYDIAKMIDEDGKIDADDYLLGLAEQGVGLAEIRVANLTPDQQKALEEATNKIISGEITVDSE
ncbi:BMP family ABC transporter substrate-binding protein [Robertmurraya yapensis]|uniref:BMP family ABC transporter substrate-binding protein n=1 Tax=Bacillus yapensis TaxID=2492960 RepID=A0A3S0RU63_9BACI|nr:BMP family ABC transporter substrate-binding protein [Bacillus yapensis]RTR36350.1 BMP family ABC transporter substrate-binding protein [Bacillus yapensis]TKT05853.1 BMP family ABC transporter substrate-binding protein [Bacillus yapensis]